MNGLNFWGKQVLLQQFCKDYERIVTIINQRDLNTALNNGSHCLSLATEMLRNPKPIKYCIKCMTTTMTMMMMMMMMMDKIPPTSWAVYKTGN